MNENQFIENEKQQEGIALKTLFYLFKRNIILICVITFVFTVFGFVYGKFVQKPTYSAKTTAVVQVDNSSMSEYNAFVYAQYLVNSMAEFIVSDVVTYEVAKEVINWRLGITEKKDADGNTTYYSSVLNKDLSTSEYEKKIISKRSTIKSGTKITTNTESLIVNIKYSCVEIDEQTEEEVLQVISLLVTKTKEVALTMKNDKKSSYKFPESTEGAVTESIKKALKDEYSLEEVYSSESENGEIVKKFQYYKGYDKKGDAIRFTEEELTAEAQRIRDIIEPVFNVAYIDGSLVFSIKSIDTLEKYKIEKTIVLRILEELTSFAKDNPDHNKYVEEYLYPTFANKLVEMDGTPAYASKSSKTMTFTLLSCIVGFALSCGIILIKHLLDDTFTSKEELEKLLGANVLTIVEKFEIKEEE